MYIHLLWLRVNQEVRLVIELEIYLGKRPGPPETAWWKNEAGFWVYRRLYGSNPVGLEEVCGGIALAWIDPE